MGREGDTPPEEDPRMGVGEDLHLQMQYLTLYPSFTIGLLCDHGQVTQPLWASVSLS